MPIHLSCAQVTLIKLGIQLAIFIGFYVFYIVGGMENRLSWTILFFPLLVVIMGLLEIMA